MAIVGRNKSKNSGGGGRFGFKPSSPSRKSKAAAASSGPIFTPANPDGEEDPPASAADGLKVNIVPRNRATETTPATNAMTPDCVTDCLSDTGIGETPVDCGTGVGGENPYNVSDMMNSALNQVTAPLEACGVLEKSSPGRKSRSGGDAAGRSFAKPAVWGVPPVLSQDEDDTIYGRNGQGRPDTGDPNDAGEYDDVELVLDDPNRTPNRSSSQAGGARTPSGTANLAGAMEAEALRQHRLMAARNEQDEVVSATRRNLLKDKEDRAALRDKEDRALLAAASRANGGRPPLPFATSPSTVTEDFVDPEVAAALETWRSATDPATGRTYYYNRVTKETKWDPPPELVDAYRSVVAKKAALERTQSSNNNQRGSGVGTGAAVVGGAAVLGGAAAVAASSDSKKKSPLSKAEKSLRKMLGIGSKKGKGTDPLSADEAVRNGVAAAERELPEDEITGSLAPGQNLGGDGLSPTSTFESNVEVEQGSDGVHVKKGGMMAAVVALRSRTRSLPRNRSLATDKSQKKKKKKAPGWRSAVDPNSGKTYYYHSVTKETRWDKPADYDEANDPSKNKKKKGKKGKKDPPGSRKPKAKRAIWKEATDSNSGKTYYYHTITKEVTWIKPAGFDEQQELLQKEKEERQRKREEAKQKKRAAVLAATAAANGPAFDPVNLELQKALARALPDQQEQHDELLEKYKGREDDLLTGLEELQEDTPFDERITYDAVVEKMDQIERRKSYVGLAGAAVTAAAAAVGVAAAAGPSSTDQPSKAPSLGRTYSTYTSGTGMRSEITERINNVTKTAASPGVAPIAEDDEDDDESSISSNGEEGAEEAALRQPSDAVRTRSQQSSVKLLEDSYVSNNQSMDHHSVSDSVSAISNDIEYAGIRARAERRQKKALNASIEEKDWNKAATVATELSKRERSNDSHQRSSARYRSSSRNSSALDISASSSKEFNQSELDQYIAKNDWNSVAQYIAVMRSASQDDRDKSHKRTSSRDTRSQASYEPAVPRKQVGARSQLQYTHSSDSEYSDEWESDSQASDGSDWESYTSGPQGPPSYSSNKDARESHRNDNVPAAPLRKMQV